MKAMRKLINYLKLPFYFLIALFALSFLVKYLDKGKNPVITKDYEMVYPKSKIKRTSFPGKKGEKWKGEGPPPLNWKGGYEVLENEGRRYWDGEEWHPKI